MSMFADLNTLLLPKRIPDPLILSEWIERPDTYRFRRDPEQTQPVEDDSSYAWLGHTAVIGGGMVLSAAIGAVATGTIMSKCERDRLTTQSQQHAQALRQQDTALAASQAETARLRHENQTLRNATNPFRDGAH